MLFLLQQFMTRCHSTGRLRLRKRSTARSLVTRTINFPAFPAVIYNCQPRRKSQKTKPTKKRISSRLCQHCCDHDRAITKFNAVCDLRRHPCKRRGFNTKPARSDPLVAATVLLLIPTTFPPNKENSNPAPKMIIKRHVMDRYRLSHARLEFFFLLSVPQTP